jgi:hypothetical protein
VNESQKVFDSIESVMDRRYDLVNPVLGEFLEAEKKFFTLSAIAFKKLDGSITGKFKTIAQKIVKKSIIYDPCKYIRGGELIKRERSQSEKITTIKKEKIIFENEEYNENKSVSTISKNIIPIDKEISSKNNKELNSNFNKDLDFDDNMSRLTDKISNNLQLETKSQK